jgi:UDP-N-acetylglucosamine pyrophosphorylase
MEKHGELTYVEANSITQCLLKLQLVQEIERRRLQITEAAKRSMVFK